MTVVACSCGCTFRFDYDLGQCPYCGAAAALPHVTSADAEQMQAELQTLLELHSDSSTEVET